MYMLWSCVPHSADMVNPSKILCSTMICDNSDNHKYCTFSVNKVRGKQWKIDQQQLMNSLSNRWLPSASIRTIADLYQHPVHPQSHSVNRIIKIDQIPYQIHLDFLHLLSAFWLGSSVVYVLLSLIHLDFFTTPVIY